jgi:hemerythrin-like domain-containing protein
VSATQDLKQDHVAVRRIRDIAQRCSDKLYAGKKVPLEDIGVVSVVIEEFVDTFHHGKEEKASFHPPKARATRSLKTCASSR